MNLSHAFVLNGTIIPFEFTLKFGNKIGDAISNELIKNNKYNVQSAVSKENFKIFLDFLNSEEVKYPEVNLENYYDFYLLSKEFNNILFHHLSKSEYDEICTISMLNAAIRKDINNKIYCKEYIAKNLDNYLAFYEEKMSEIPITTLYGIFNHEERILNNQERAYQFIKKNQSKNINDKNSFCILYETIDAIKINVESFNECFSQKDEHIKFLPKLRFSVNDSINKNFSDFKNQIENKFEQTFNDFFQQQKQMMNEIITLSKQTKEAFQDIKSMTENIESIQNDIKQMNENNDKTQLKFQQISDENSQIKDEIKNLSNSIKNVDNEITQISPTIKTTQTKVSSICDKIENIENQMKEISKPDTETKNKVQQIIANSEQTKNKINEIYEKLDIITKDSIEIHKKCEYACNRVDQFPNKINNIENVSNKIFEKVCETLYLSHPFNCSFGIIHQLTKECGGNVSDKGIVDITASSTYSAYLPKNATYNSKNDFMSENIENSWLKYDFKNKKVCPTYYIIRSINACEGNGQLMNWVIEGSNSDSSNDWTILDSRNNITSLDDRNAVQSFSIQNPSIFYRYLRIRQTGKNSGGNNYLKISALEYFGSIQ